MCSNQRSHLEFGKENGTRVPQGQRGSSSGDEVPGNKAQAVLHGAAFKAFPAVAFSPLTTEISHLFESVKVLKARPLGCSFFLRLC